MANKRTLKKQIRYICGDCAAECAMASEVIPGIDCDKLTDAICSLAALQTDSLSKVSFNEALLAIVKEMNSALPSRNETGKVETK